MKKGVTALFIGLIAMCATAVSVASFSLAWFRRPGDDMSEEIVDGQIALRGYFFSGNGSEENPYEIVSPIHFYNLSRLQNLGVFPTTAHFRIGHDFDPDDGITDYECLDSLGNHADYLDMGPFLSETGLTIRPVGTESTPFRGIFKGNGIPIKNLVISGYPEDIGVFGYVSYDGSIEGLVCSDLEIHSLGYTKITTDEDIFNLYNPNIDDIFNGAAHYLASQTSLSFYEKTGPTSYTENALKAVNGVGGTTFEGLDANVIQVPIGSDVDDSNKDDRFVSEVGYFLPTYPSVIGDPFTYSWSSSSSLIRETDALNVDLDGDGVNDKVIAFDLNLLKYAGDGENEFNNTERNMMVNARLSLTASVTVDGIIYSRVIQSYGLEFYSNNHTYGDGEVSVSIFCNYLTPEDPTHPDTNYHHGNNIGFLVGHLDGTLENSYVYHGSFVFNDDDDCHPIITETQTGLVGEVGTNVVNALNPDYNNTVNGAIGVMNFTRIYSGIRNDFSGGETIYSGTESGKKFVCYDEDTSGNSIINTNPSTTLYSKYEDYLRHTDSGRLITPVDGNDVSGSTWGTSTVPATPPAKFNSVEFLYNKLIEDEYVDDVLTVDRGLGVFKIATPRNTSSGADDPSKYGLHVYDNWGDCTIYSGTPHNKVYFSTAEYNHLYSGYNPNWGITTDKVDPLRATTLPSYSDVFTFGYPFSRDYNYVFQLDLTQNTPASTHNYMYNTSSEFLTNYLTSILKDKNGEAITHGNYRFGFMFRSSENITLNSLSSYMPVSKPGNAVNYGSGKYYPSNSIIFKIDNDAGANVSVIGSERNISIYKFRTTGTNTPVEMYTMYCENILSDDPRYLDSHRYFTYDYTQAVDNTSEVCVPYSENNMGEDPETLYAHIFHLPKSEDGYMYAIGMASSGFAKEYDPSKGARAKLYYLAVQGQTAGTIDTNNIADVGNHLNNVDFLTTEPTKADYSNVSGYAAKRSYVNFSANFNTTDGQLDIDSKTVSTNNYLLFSFNNNPQFIMAMTAYDFKNEHAYYVNSEPTPRDTASSPIV